MTDDRIRLTAVIKTPADLAFIENAGGNIGRGAKQAGFDRLLAFAQHTPRAFQAFLSGHEFADIGEIITVREGDYVCPACGEVVVQVAEQCAPEGDEACPACNGSGYYDADGSPPCAACEGTGER